MAHGFAAYAEVFKERETLLKTCTPMCTSVIDMITEYAGFEDYNVLSEPISYQMKWNKGDAKVSNEELRAMFIREGIDMPPRIAMNFFTFCDEKESTSVVVTTPRKDVVNWNVCTMVYLKINVEDMRYTHNAMIITNDEKSKNTIVLERGNTIYPTFVNPGSSVVMNNIRVDDGCVQFCTFYNISK